MVYRKYRKPTEIFPVNIENAYGTFVSSQDIVRLSEKIRKAGYLWCLHAAEQAEGDLCYMEGTGCPIYIGSLAVIVLTCTSGLSLD